jgi:predicted permease
MFNTLLKDIRYAVRRLIKSPIFTATTVLSLALGIGGNVLIFSLINAFMFNPLSVVKNPHEVVWVYSSMTNGPAYLSSTYPDFLDYREQNDVFRELSAFDGIELSMNLGGELEIVRGAIVTGNLFSVLNVDAISGRTFLPEEDQRQGTHPVAMLSHGFWQRRFGGDPNVVGKPIELNGLSFTVVGITPPGFTGAEGVTMPDLWVPMMMYNQLYPPVAKNPDRLSDRNTHWLNIVGRLKPGVSLEQAEAAMSTIAGRLAQEHPESNKDWGVKLALMSGRLDPREREEMLTVAGLLMGVVGVVLLIACANVANLLLMRASLRQKEMAICLALGARRGHLVSQFLVETLLLFLLGGIAGLLLARWVIEVLQALIPDDRPLSIGSSVDLRVLMFTLLLSSLTGIIFGLAPALRASSPNLTSALKDEGFAGNAGYRRSRLRSLFVVAQVTLSLVLLIGAGLLIRSLLNARAIDPGFQVENGVMVPLDFKLQRYDETRGKEFHRQVLERVGALPGVQAVSLVRDIPLGSSSGNVEVSMPPKQSGADGFTTMVGANMVGPKYFQTMSIPLAAGREFTEQDREGAPEVIIVNELLARRLWPNQNPLGQRISISGQSGPYLEIVGVAKDSKYRSLEEGPTTFVYQPLLQANYQPRLTLVARTTGDPQLVLQSMRSQVRELDDKLPLTGWQTLSEHVSQALLPARIAAWFLGLFGLLALVLAAVGLYGVVAYSVSQRTHEIGIRMALGAQPRDILKMVLREGMSLVVIGLGLGLVLAFIVTRLLSSFVYGISSTDPLTFGGVALLLAIVALAASYLPARRAIWIDPNLALRHN